MTRDDFRRAMSAVSRKEDIRSRDRISGDGAGAAMPLAAYRFRNSEVFTSDGDSGRVMSVLLGDDGRRDLQPRSRR
jgi:hypothetical protein